MVRYCSVIKYSSSSTACCILSEDLPLPLSECKFLSCVDITSYTLVRHLDNPAAWLHITVLWLRAREGGAEGGAVDRLRLDTLLNALFSFAGSGDQEHTVDLPESFLSTCRSYHLDDLGGLTNWSLKSPAVYVILEG